MSMTEAFLPEFEHEMATTRRLLERVPDDKVSWKPHEKSFSLGHLAQLISRMPGWIGQTLLQSEINLAEGAGYSNEKTSTLVEQFDKNVSETRDAISKATDEQLNDMWALKAGDKVLMSQPRGVAIRGHLNHLVHHRGQLSVYLRMNDVPLPSIYGPTADEPWGSAPK